ncbi:kinase-like domain-containing protein [Paraphoma chrysanthemicola]|uniref:Kinase-like domain-containing protein n=1 Tax=Paraphoma chrysanthemicola TaxID=798071 RepID=A0A8K0RG55_9PLEO|nr:kinase-like domain-containing protein [Paraphoma chrysanthemicola]
MDSLGDRIIELQTRNAECAAFMPAGELEKVLTEKVVRDILNASSVEIWNQEEITRVVISGARRIFAILVLQDHVHFFIKFLRQDQLHSGELDAKLPFQESLLESLLGKAAGRRFWTSQWTFIAPIFRHDLSHRKLDYPVVLPFIGSSEPIGEGAFGVVTKVTLHKQHQAIQSANEDSQALVLVRKCIQLSSASNATHEQEGNVLSALRLIQHPNVVRLVTTFEYRNTYNLLFEPADFGLHDLLGMENRPPLWHEDNTFFAALQGVCSALSALHEYRISGLNFELIGCHHDLKPANILVKGDRFLLADFGLSRLKSVDGDYKTQFRGMNYHNAPECLGLDGGYKHLRVGRKSDIWAMGTIMLDVVTYLQQGTQGVKAFEKGRKHKSGVVTFYTFHNAGHDHPFVHSHVQTLEGEVLPSWRTIFPLILSTLQVEPEIRPSAKTLLNSMSFVALRIQTLAVHSRLQAYAAFAKNSFIDMEFKTLSIWSTLMGLSEAAEAWSCAVKVTNADIDFSRLISCLLELEHGINGLETTGVNPTTWTIRQLSRPIGRLVAEMNFATRAKLYNTLDVEYLQDIERSQWSEISTNGLHVEDPSLSCLAMAKVVAQQASTPIVWPNSPSELGDDTIKSSRSFGSQSAVATMHGHDETPVLIEYIQYDEKWVGDVRKELLQRVQGLATVLHMKPKPPGFSTLHCVGFYHAKDINSFGLVSEYPPSTSQLKTLQQLFAELPVQNTIAQPSLGDIFKLSRALANSLLQFHKVSWLHKNISSFNICFACHSDDPKAVDVSKPYLIGFNYSRPDSTDAFTHGPNEDPEQKDYSHPAYLRDEKRFRYMYDYYSLGLVLLEIGLWRPLRTLTATMSKEKDQSPEALRRFLLDRYVPRLASTRGSIYKGVVEKCLNSKFPDEETDTSTSNVVLILTTFEEHVVAPLATCNG